jgi:hypothetical protein
MALIPHTAQTVSTLTFADPNDLGHDSSGNNNDFTAVGFDTAPVGIFSVNQWGSAPGNYQTEASGNRYQPIAAINAFNGDIMSQSQVTPAQSWWYWVQSLTGVNTLRFNYSSQSTPTEVPNDGIVNELAWVPASGTSNTAVFAVELITTDY